MNAEIPSDSLNNLFSNTKSWWTTCWDFLLTDASFLQLVVTNSIPQQQLLWQLLIYCSIIVCWELGDLEKAKLRYFIITQWHLVQCPTRWNSIFFYFYTIQGDWFETHFFVLPPAETLKRCLFEIWINFYFSCDF